MEHSCRIFYILEILRAILDNLTDDKKSTVYFAYTSKAMSAAALDCLWADMDSFSPFVPLLPESVQVIWDLGYNIATSPLIKFPPSEEWKRFNMYARRVRRLRPGESYQERAFYQRLVSLRPGVDLFPNLSTLQCYLFFPLSSRAKMFPSSLRSLTLSPDYSFELDGRAELALRQAGHDAPFLEELHINGAYRLHPDTGLRPLDFKRLHTVHLNTSMLPPDLKSFSHLLSASPILNLDITLRSSSEVSFKLDGPCCPAGTFPLVENIFIRGRPRRAIDIVSWIQSPYLKSVTIDYWDPCASILEYEPFFTLLAQRHPPVSSLEIRMRHTYYNFKTEHFRGFLTALEPLVHAGLVRLRIEMSLCGAWMIEEDVKKRLRPEAWPSLAYFEFVLTELGNPPLDHV